jgi:hypothetical protein
MSVTTITNQKSRKNASSASRRECPSDYAQLLADAEDVVLDDNSFVDNSRVDSDNGSRQQSMYEPIVPICSRFNCWYPVGRSSGTKPRLVSRDHGFFANAS